MKVINVWTSEGHFGYHATCYQSPNCWSTSRVSPRTAAYRCALNVFFGHERKEGRSFEESVGVFVIPGDKGLWIAVALNPNCMGHECYEALAMWHATKHETGQETDAPFEIRLRLNSGRQITAKSSARRKAKRVS